MNTQQFSPNTTVADALKQGKQISSIFIKLKTDCAGCYLTRFCTLEDAAKAYDLSMDDLLGELRLAVQTTHSLIRSNK